MLLAILVVARLGASLQSTILSPWASSAPAYFRLVRSGTLTAKHSLFVEAAQLLTGASDIRILARHVLPSTASSIIVLASMRSGLLLLAGA